MWWLWSLSASAWTPSEPLPLQLGPAAALAVAPVGERAALLVGGEQGLVVLDLATGEALARAPEPLRDLWVGDADGDGGRDVVGCGPGGLGAYGLELSGEGELQISRKSVSDGPCEAVERVSTPTGQALLVVSEGALYEVFPSLLGPRQVPHPEHAPQSPPQLATSGFAVAVVDQQGALQRLLGPDAGMIVQPPVLAVAGWAPAPEPRFAALRGGESPELVLSSGPLPVPGGATGLVAGEAGLWVLDAAGSRLGVPELDEIAWFPSPLPPKLAVAADLDRDGCEDLVISDGAEAGALIRGDCRAPALAAAVLDVPLVELPPPPEVLELRQEWPIVHVRVGEPVRMRVKDAQTGWGRFLSRGGPPGFAVLTSGEIEFEADPEDVGRWRVSVRSSEDGVIVRWTGFELAVWPGLPDPGEPEPEILAATDPEEIDLAARVPQVEPEPSAPPRARQSYAPRRCLLGMGVAGGAARAGGSTWENLGAANVRGGVSPLASVACGFGTDSTHFVVGLDSAPYFRYGDVPQDRRHLLALSAGIDAVLGATSLGVMASIGSTSRGLGPRVTWLGLRDWKNDPMGIEARVLWLPPKAGLEASIAWAWTL
jgi:hypothetical protein